MTVNNVDASQQQYSYSDSIQYTKSKQTSKQTKKQVCAQGAKDTYFKSIVTPNLPCESKFFRHRSQLSSTRDTVSNSIDCPARILALPLLVTVFLSSVPVDALVCSALAAAVVVDLVKSFDR
jgi:hypothetical protein